MAKYLTQMIPRISMLSLPMYALRSLVKGIRFYCNQQKRTFYRRCTCVSLTIILCVLLFILFIFSVIVQFSRYSPLCSDTESKLYLEQLVGSKIIVVAKIIISYQSIVFSASVVEYFVL